VIYKAREKFVSRVGADTEDFIVISGSMKGLNGDVEKAGKG
jgi:hypothetical protein